MWVPLVACDLNGTKYARCLRCNTLTVIHKPQIHLPNSNPSYVNKEDEFVDEKFQEDEFIDEEFKH